MAIYHFNSETGEAGRCRAKKACPFGDMKTDHFDRPEKARAAYEKKRGLDTFINFSKSFPQLPLNQAPHARLSYLDFKASLRYNGVETSYAYYGPGGSNGCECPEDESCNCYIYDGAKVTSVYNLPGVLSHITGIEEDKIPEDLLKIAYSLEMDSVEAYEARGESDYYGQTLEVRLADPESVETVMRPWIEENCLDCDDPIGIYLAGMNVDARNKSAADNFESFKNEVSKNLSPADANLVSKSNSYETDYVNRSDFSNVQKEYPPFPSIPHGESYDVGGLAFRKDGKTGLLAGKLTGSSAYEKFVILKFED